MGGDELSPAIPGRKGTVKWLCPVPNQRAGLLLLGAASCWEPRDPHTCRPGGLALLSDGESICHLSHRLLCPGWGPRGGQPLEHLPLGSSETYFQGVFHGWGF